MLPDARSGQLERWSIGSDSGSSRTKLTTDRAKNIFGTWKWIPAQAIEKQLKDLFENLMPNTEGDKLKVKVLDLDVMRPRANYAFVKFAPDAETGKS